MLIYNKLGLFDRIYPEEIITNRRTIYKIKWNTIKNCIYAVDIENSAVDITKLRLWLSIVVDQIHVPKTGPEPLQNLDCKIMQGNSLIDEFNGIKLIDFEGSFKIKNEFWTDLKNLVNIKGKCKYQKETRINAVLMTNTNIEKIKYLYVPIDFQKLKEIKIEFGKNCEQKDIKEIENIVRNGQIKNIKLINTH